MQRDYARIARAIGKAFGARQEAVAGEPLPQRLTELLCRLSDKESRRDSAERTVVPFTSQRAYACRNP
jgi:hypothetical protein